MDLPVPRTNHLTNERLMDQLDASRDPVHRAEPSSRKFKPVKYGGAIDCNINSWLAMMRIHMDQEASLPESD